MTQLEQILKNMQLEIDLIKRQMRELKDDNHRLKQQIGQRNNDMKFYKE